MPRPAVRPIAADPDPEPGDDERPEPQSRASLTPAAAASIGSLADLPVAGLTRRRIGLAIGAVLAAWVIVLFARQVGEASEAASRADDMRASKAALTRDVAALERVTQIQRQTTSAAGREYRLRPPRGSFVLADNAAARRRRTGVRRGSPRRSSIAAAARSWLDLLSGSGGRTADPKPGPRGRARHRRLTARGINARARPASRSPRNRRSPGFGAAILCGRPAPPGGERVLDGRCHGGGPVADDHDPGRGSSSPRARSAACCS
jgi:hypothetical protein